MTIGQPASSSRNPWVIVAIIAVVLVALCLLVTCVVLVVVPTLLGPAVGNVFSSVVSTAQPTP